MVTEFPQITTPFPWRRVSTDSKNFLASAPGDGNFRVTRKPGSIRPAES